MNTLTTHRGTRASFWRGGTSNGILFHSQHIPGWPSLTRSQKTNPSILQETVTDFLAAVMGAPDPYIRELNGMGQGISSTSKIMICERSEVEGVDVDYWFVQVGITSGKSDFSGNCGNLSSAVAPWALNFGLLGMSEELEGRLEGGVNVNGEGRRTGVMKVVLRNRNTDKIITARIVVVEDEVGWRFEEDGDFAIDGVSQTSTPITLTFHSPAGSQTPSALPTGTPTTTLTVSNEPILATLSDISNPAILLRGSDFSYSPSNPPDTLTSNIPLITKLEAIRQAGATAMGLDPKNEGTPAIVLLYAPTPEEEDVDIVARAVCMKQAHKAVPMTFGMNVAAASKMPGTIAWELVREGSREEGVVKIGHPSGVVRFGAEMDRELGRVVSTQVVRTARPLMEGFVNHYRRM